MIGLRAAALGYSGQSRPVIRLVPETPEVRPQPHPRRTGEQERSQDLRTNEGMTSTGQRPKSSGSAAQCEDKGGSTARARARKIATAATGEREASVRPPLSFALVFDAHAHPSGMTVQREGIKHLPLPRRKRKGIRILVWEPPLAPALRNLPGCRFLTAGAPFTKLGRCGFGSCRSMDSPLWPRLGWPWDLGAKGCGEYFS